jgi:hypothetical protein
VLATHSRALAVGCQLRNIYPAKGKHGLVLPDRNTELAAAADPDDGSHVQLAADRPLPGGRDGMKWPGVRLPNDDIDSRKPMHQNVPAIPNKHGRGQDAEFLSRI